MYESPLPLVVNSLFTLKITLCKRRGQAKSNSSEKSCRDEFLRTLLASKSTLSTPSRCSSSNFFVGTSSLQRQWMTSRRHLVHIWCKHFAPDSVCRRCRRSHQWNLQFLSCTRLKIWRGLPTPFQILKVVRTYTRPDEVLFSAFRFDGLIPWSQ